MMALQNYYCYPYKYLIIYELRFIDFWKSKLDSMDFWFLDSFQKASALWADAFFKSKCPYVCLFVRLFTFWGTV